MTLLSACPGGTLLEPAREREVEADPGAEQALRDRILALVHRRVRLRKEAIDDGGRGHEARGHESSPHRSIRRRSRRRSRRGR